MKRNLSRPVIQEFLKCEIAFKANHLMLLWVVSDYISLCS